MMSAASIDPQVSGEEKRFLFPTGRRDVCVCVCVCMRVCARACVRACATGAGPCASHSEDDATIRKLVS